MTDCRDSVAAAWVPSVDLLATGVNVQASPVSQASRSTTR